MSARVMHKVAVALCFLIFVGFGVPAQAAAELEMPTRWARVACLALAPPSSATLEACNTNRRCRWMTTKS